MHQGPHGLLVRGGWELGGCVNQARVGPRSWLDCCFWGAEADARLFSLLKYELYEVCNMHLSDLAR